MKNMNKKTLIIIAAVVVVLAVAAIILIPKLTGKNENAGTGTEGVTTIQRGKLLVATSPDFPPFESTDDNDAIIGIEPDILSLIAKNLNLTIEYMPMDFTSALAAAQTGKADVVMSGVTASGETGEARRQQFDFTDTYVSIQQAIVFKAGADISMENLGEKTIGVQRGTTGQIYVEEAYGAEKVVGYDTYSLVFQALQNDQIECIVVDDMVAKAYVAKIPGLAMAQTTFAPEDFAFGVYKQDTGLRDAISAELKKLIDDGTVQSIIDKYNAPAQ